jgi:plastocyanin
MTTRIAVALLLAALAFPSAAAQADNPRLVAVVGTNDAFVISLRDASGNVVTHLDPGTYDVSVSDRSQMHNFHFKGPGVNNATAVEAIQDAPWTVTLSDGGRYSFMCDPHSTTMRGFFTVGTLAPTRLAASVGPRKTISLTPKTVDLGPATITVSDRSRTDNFHLTGPGVNRKTGVATRSRVTWSVTLQPGRYMYRSDKTKRLRGSVTVRFPG